MPTTEPCRHLRPQTGRSDAQRRLYRLRPEPLIELDQWLEPYRQLWRASLDKLEEHLAGAQPQDERTHP